MQSMSIGHMSWTEYREYAEHNDMIIIPLGVTEEHGPHNPLGTDYFAAEAAAKLIGEKTGVAVAPMLPFGVSPGVMGFPGSITIDPMLYQKIIMAYCESYIRTGIKRILFINGHGGNDDVLSLVCQNLYCLHKVVAIHNEWWEILPDLDKEMSCADHGGYFETSLMLAVKPEAVDMSKAMDCPSVSELTSGITYAKGWRFKDARINVPVTLDIVQKVGNAGLSPLKANAGLGEEMMKKYVDYNVELIAEMKKINFV